MFYIQEVSNVTSNSVITLKIFLLNDEFWKDTHVNDTSDKGQLPTEYFYVL